MLVKQTPVGQSYRLVADDVVGNQRHPLLSPGTSVPAILFYLLMNKDLTPLLSEPDTTIAVVGATDTPGKYGGIIYRDLKAKEFKVFAVNPGRETVDGDPCYPTVLDIPQTPTIAVLVVPAPRGIRVLESCKEAGVENIWVQPGAFSPALRESLESGGFDWIAEACVMVRARVSRSVG
jgi:predicted CoA-binding protein